MDDVHLQRHVLVHEVGKGGAVGGDATYLGGGEKDVKTREMMCKFFAAKLFDLMGWDAQYRYKILGKPASCDGELLFLFKLNDFELFVSGKRKGSYLPSQWRDYFGVPVEEHVEEYKVNLAEGYITTDKV